MVVYRKDDGSFDTKVIADIGDNIPVDISIAPDDSKVYVNTFGDGTMRIYDVTNPMEGKLLQQVKLGEQANMISTSWDGKRVYATSSLLSRWDKPDASLAEGLRVGGRHARAEVQRRLRRVGRAHIMNFGSKSR